MTTSRGPRNMLSFTLFCAVLLSGTSIASPIQPARLLERQNVGSTQTSTGTTDLTTSTTQSSSITSCVATITPTANEQCADAASTITFQDFFPSSLSALLADSDDCSEILGVFGVCIAEATSSATKGTTTSTPTQLSSNATATSSTISQGNSTQTRSPFPHSTTRTERLTWTQETAFTSTETTTRTETLTTTGKTRTTIETTVIITQASPDDATSSLSDSTSSTTSTSSSVSSSTSFATSSSASSSASSTSGATLSSADSPGISSSSLSSLSPTGPSTAASSSINQTATTTGGSGSAVPTANSLNQTSTDASASGSAVFLLATAGTSLTVANKVTRTTTKTMQGSQNTASSSSSASLTSGLVTSVSAVPNTIYHNQTDVYKMYTGNGTIAAGWPFQGLWVDFDYMFDANAANMRASCARWNVANNTDEEMSAIKHSVLHAAKASNIDARFILATLLQESSGCVRVITTHSDVANPGLMQSHAGAGTCNPNHAAINSHSKLHAKARAAVQHPCPVDNIRLQIAEGVRGTQAGDGLEQLMQKQGRTDVSRFYRTARLYNGGSIDESGDLGLGCCTACYASDIANRLTGWVNAPSKCTL